MSSMTWNHNRWAPPWSVTSQNLLIPGKNTKNKAKRLLPKVTKIQKLMKNFNLARISLAPMKIENISKVHTKTKSPWRKKSRNTLRINMIWHLRKNTNNLPRFSIMSICLNRLLNKLKVLIRSRRKDTMSQGMRISSKEMSSKIWTNSTTCSLRKWTIRWWAMSHYPPSVNKFSEATVKYPTTKI